MRGKGSGVMQPCSQHDQIFARPIKSVQKYVMAIRNANCCILTGKFCYKIYRGTHGRLGSDGFSTSIWSMPVQRSEV